MSKCQYKEEKNRPMEAVFRDKFKKHHSEIIL